MTGKLCYIVLLLLVILVPASYIRPASAKQQTTRELSLQVSPSSVAAGGSVKISADIKANNPIKVGMLIYRLVGPGDDVQYLEPIIIRDFVKGSEHHTDTDYQVGSSTGDWNVEAYLCIGRCNIKGESPPGNAAATASSMFTVTEGIIQFEQPSGVIQFPH